MRSYSVTEGKLEIKREKLRFGDSFKLTYFIADLYGKNPLYFRFKELNRMWALAPTVRARGSLLYGHSFKAQYQFLVCVHGCVSAGYGLLVIKKKR